MGSIHCLLTTELHTSTDYFGNSGNVWQLNKAFLVISKGHLFEELNFSMHLDWAIPIYICTPLSRNRKIPWGRAFFPNGKFHGGRHFWTGNSKEGVKNTYKMLENPCEGVNSGREVNSVRNSMGGWLTCVRNSMEWSKNAVGNSMGGGKKMGFLNRRGVWI